MECIKIENLNFSYPNNKSFSLVDVNLSVKSGEFLLLFGESGCGKTTLLKMLKRELSPHGTCSGKIYLNGVNQSELSDRDSAGMVGYILQNPEQQIVTDRVWHELSFGMENLGYNQDFIRRRVAELVSFFGLENIYHSKTSELSGGEKQLVNLASVIAVNPKILLLDEPTAQLDPIAAHSFIETISRLNREWGITVIISEHRTEEIFPIADRVAVMKDGKIIIETTPNNLVKSINNPKISLGFPTPVRLFEGLSRDLKKNSKDDCPLTVKQARQFVQENFYIEKSESDVKNFVCSDERAVEMKNVSFRYTSDSRDIANDLNLTVYRGEVYSLLGGNGAGKTTLLKLISNLEKPYSGKINIFEKNIKKYRMNSLYKETLASLPQNPQEVFVKSTVIDDFEEIKKVMNYSDEDFKSCVHTLSEKFGIEKLLNSHPYDLSGGEQQKVAILKLLLLKPKIILLDEPTKGLDAYSKKTLQEIILKLKEEKITVFIVTHDVEFAAICSDRCGLLFNGEIVSEDVPQRFFSENIFYTTSASRIAAGIFKNVVTCDELVKICKENKVK